MIVVNLLESPRANSDEQRNDIHQIVKKVKKLDPELPDDVVCDPILLGEICN